MKRLVEKVFTFTEAQRADGFADYIITRNVHGRMEIAQSRVIPHIVQAIPDLKSKSVLEIGCGTGSATAPLAMVSRHVYGFDLHAPYVDVASARCKLMGIDNISMFAQSIDWPDRFATTPICDPVEVIVCYALLEHLLPQERIDVLVGAWKHLPVGGHLVVIETPNRLYPFDWHSWQIPFMDQLPDEIAYLWSAFSARGNLFPDICATTRQFKGNRDRLYRGGRGVSFHEFHTVLGVDAYKVIASFDRMEMAGTKAEYIDMLKRQLSEVSPPVHSGFAYPSLDLVIEKIGPARLG